MQRIYAIGLLICLLAACRKQHDEPTRPGNGRGDKPDSSMRIKSINNNKYAYDNRGRVVRVTYSNSLTARTDYTYTKDSVSGMDFDMMGQPHGGSVAYYLGNDGLAVRVRYVIDVSVPPLIFNFTYSAGQLTEQTIAEGGKAPNLRTVRYYSNGNLDSIRSFTIPGNVLVEVDRYEYYTDRPNWLGNEYNGISFLGKSSANLMKKEVWESTGTTMVTEYTYEFDDKGLPVKRHTIVDGSPGGDLTYTWY